MKDIIPYPEELAKELGACLFKLNAPSLGLRIGLQLRMVRDHVRAVAERWEKNPEVEREAVILLLGYANRINDVIQVEASLQARVLEAVAEAIGINLNSDGEPEKGK